MPVPMINILIIGAAILLMLWHFRPLYVYHKNTQSDTPLPPRFLLGIGTFCVFIAFVSFTIRPSTWIWRSIGVFGVYYGITISQFVLKEILGEQRQTIARNKQLLLMTGCAIVAILLDLARGDNDGLFFYDDPFYPTVTYYGYHAWYFFVLLCLNISMARTYWRATRVRSEVGLRDYNDLNVLFRLYCGLLSFVMGSIGASALEMNLVLSLFFRDAYQASLNALLFGSVLVSVILLVVGFAPPVLMSLVTRRFNTVLVRRYQHERDRLRYLHDRLVRIVPIVQLPGGELKEARVLVEIGHARRLIGSHIARTGPVSVKAEAEYIHRLLQEGVVIHKAGEHPPLPKCQHVQAHYRALARWLQVLGQQQLYTAEKEVTVQ